MIEGGCRIVMCSALVLLMCGGCGWFGTPTHTTEEPVVYTVTYNPNGAARGSAPADLNEYEAGETVTALGNAGTLEIANYVFSGWNTVADGTGTTYHEGDTFAMEDADVTLYARWDSFRDDFTRADTTGRNLGTAWDVRGVDTDEMYILDNEVYSRFRSSDPGALSATYTGLVEYTEPLRMSVRFKVGSPPDWPVEILGMVLSTVPNTWEGYFLQLNYSVGAGHSLFLSEFDGTTTVNPVSQPVTSLSFDTWYVLELESDGTNISGRVRDTSGTSLGSVSLTDDPRTYTTGALGFYNFTIDADRSALEYPVSFDDFVLEVME